MLLERERIKADPYGKFALSHTDVWVATRTYNITPASVAPQLAKQRHACACALPPSLRAAGWAGGPAAPALALRLLPAFPALPERFRSFTELKRGEFEVMGFGGLDPAEKELQFDLTEVLMLI